MSLIEGIGDEVVALAAFLVVATTIVAAWFSTRVPVRPGPQVRVVQARITHIRGSHPGSTTSTSTAADPSGENASEEGSRNNIPDPPSEGPQETDPERTNSQVESTEQSFDESISNMASSETAQSQTISSAKTVEQTVNADDTDSAGSRKEKSDISIETNKSQEQAVEELGETIGESTSSGIEELGSNLYSSAEDQRTDEENVLRNRNTGQVYPTLPPYGSADQASGGVSEGASNVEDSRTEGDDEETSRAQEGGICIRVKFSSEGERLVHTTSEETLGQFRRQNFVEEIEAGKLVRFIANGQFLSDDSQTLASLNLTNNSVLHCHLTQGEQIRQTQHNAEDHDLDLGHFMVPLFGCILAFVWYLRWQYRYMFNATSTLSLIGVSVLFFLAVLAAWRG